MPSMTGKTAIVTGAASGIGLAIGRHFVERGANVMFADMDEDRLRREVGEADAQRCFAGDLRERLALANLLSATIEAFDQVDILVNATRQVCETEDPLDHESDAVELMLHQNLFTALRTSQLVAKTMIRQAEARGGDPGERRASAGTIVNLSSVAARCAQPGLLAYSVASAALEQMTRSLALELAPHGIRVNAVALGSVRSSSLQKRLRENDEYRGAIERGTPMGRIAEATELVGTVEYLASESASFTTGQVVTVDGGRTLVDPVAAPAH